MARMMRRVGETVLVIDGAAPARHIWSRWMDRALAPHETAMTNRPDPIPANDILPAEDGNEDEEPSPVGAHGEPDRVLRFD